MQQPYFVVVFAHSFHGRLRRVQIPQQAMYGVLLLSLLGAMSVFGFLGSYVRMVWKVADYNNLRHEISALRQRYRRLETEQKQTGQQLASLQLLANEVSFAYGLKRRIEGPADIASEGPLIPTVSQSLETYNFLRGVTPPHRSGNSFLIRPAMLPSTWPLDGRLMSSFGHRSDPFSGEGAFHTGVDISASTGTPVRVTADGTVIRAEYSGNYGKLIVVDHGNGFQTYYAHLSKIDVAPGQTLRRGENVGLSGGTGRVTSPHLHYEVRRGGSPINAYAYLKATGSYGVKTLAF